MESTWTLVGKSSIMAIDQRSLHYCNFPTKEGERDVDEKTRCKRVKEIETLK